MKTNYAFVLMTFSAWVVLISADAGAEHPPEPIDPLRAVKVDAGRVACALVLNEAIRDYGNNIPKDYDDRMDNCLLVLDMAEGGPFDPLLLLSIAYEETRLSNPKTSDKGARGPLQVMPHHHCPNRTAQDCDLGHAAVIALKKMLLLYGCGEAYAKDAHAAMFRGWQSFQDHAEHTPMCHEPDFKVGLCHYNSGEKCFPSSRQYAHRVLRRFARVKTLLTYAIAEERN